MEQFLFIIRQQGLSPVVIFDLYDQVISIQVVVQDITYDILETYRDVVLGRTTLGELLLLRDDLLKEQKKQEILIDKRVLEQLIRGSATIKDPGIQKAVCFTRKILEGNDE